MRRALLPALLIALAGTAVAAAPAAAAISASTVTAPADELRITSTDATTTVPVSGTATGGTTGETLTFLCFSRRGVATAVGAATLTTGGGFTGTAKVADLRGPCVLRAVPAGFAPSIDAAGAFTGPLIVVEAERTRTTGDVTIGFDDWRQQSSAGVGICSLGATGLCSAGRFFDRAGRISTEPVFSGGGWIGASTADRSSVQVDGVNAYPTARAALGSGKPGLLGLTRTTTRDPGGTVTTVETNPLLRCSAGSVPTDAACTAYVDTGVRYERTTIVAPDGTTVEQRDAALATDGRPHRLSVHLGQTTLVAVGVTPALRFGWIPGDTLSTRLGGTELGGPTSGPATIFVRANAAALDDDPVYAQGAVTFDRPPASVRITAPNDLLVRFPDMTVPAAGRAEVVRSTFVLTRTAADAAVRAAAIEDAAVKPVVTFSTPAAGAVVLTPTVTVTGRASDNGGLASLTVAGVPAAVSSTGRFSVPVPMQKGANTVTAVAVDRAGNITTATLKLTYRDRLAPTVSALYLTPRVWRVGRPTQVRFNAGEAGTMRLTASRPAGGRIRAGACVAPTPALRRQGARVCIRYVKLATIVEPRRAGAVTATIGPKIGGRTLKPGRVQLRVTMTDYANNVSKARTHDTTLRAALPG
ncbi:hypothetical protein DSM112329_01423 [Paraconexibacter sp. AEG42_29]|uniref:Bacterial Ig domain-containing protein n=1 Tax=Paraconexibacter sp. AEG42_29 TaxID=2997339 RepID=A0AAU7ASF8_9ACTN